MLINTFLGCHPGQTLSYVLQFRLLSRTSNVSRLFFVRQAVSLSLSFSPSLSYCHFPITVGSDFLLLEKNYFGYVAQWFPVAFCTVVSNCLLCSWIRRLNTSLKPEGARFWSSKRFVPRIDDATSAPSFIKSLKAGLTVTPRRQIEVPIHPCQCSLRPYIGMPLSILCS